MSCSNLTNIVHQVESHEMTSSSNRPSNEKLDAEKMPMNVNDQPVNKPELVSAEAVKIGFNKSGDEIINIESKVKPKEICSNPVNTTNKTVPTIVNLNYTNVRSQRLDLLGCCGFVLIVIIFIYIMCKYQDNSYKADKCKQDLFEFKDLNSNYTDALGEFNQHNVSISDWNFRNNALNVTRTTVCTYLTSLADSCHFIQPTTDCKDCLRTICSGNIDKLCDITYYQFKDRCISFKSIHL